MEYKDKIKAYNRPPPDEVIPIDQFNKLPMNTIHYERLIADNDSVGWMWTCWLPKFHLDEIMGKSSYDRYESEAQPPLWIIWIKPKQPDGSWMPEQWQMFCICTSEYHTTRKLWDVYSRHEYVNAEVRVERSIANHIFGQVMIDTIFVEGYRHGREFERTEASKLKRPDGSSVYRNEGG